MNGSCESPSACHSDGGTEPAPPTCFPSETSPISLVLENGGKGPGEIHFTQASWSAMKSEQEKMLAGELYDALDPALVAARDRARDLCADLNNTREREQDKRRAILSELLGSGGETVWMQPPFYCDYGSNIHLGQRVYFNFNCVVLDVCEVRVGDFTFFGPAVQIYTATHPMQAALRRTQEFGKPITIGSDVWVGGGAIICPGVTIGSKTVIGAGSVVTRDIPEGVFAAGNPCRIIREITENDHDGPQP